MPTTRLYFVHALSPLHPGTGQGTGVIDLPIAHEKATGIPYLPGSSVKGTLRDSDLIPNGQKKLFFGPDTNGADEHAGAAQFADARLLLLPVRSLRGTFAWVTSPYLLRRLAREALDAGFAKDSLPAIPPISSRQQAYVSGDAILYQQDKVIIEDLDLNATRQDAQPSWATWLGGRAFPDDAAWQQMLVGRLCIVHDDTLSFLLTTATEVIARVRLDDERKAVVQGALWYEEALPTETLLVGLVLGQTIKDTNGTSFTNQQVMNALANVRNKALQLGGKATVGRGLCRVTVVGGVQ
jgi:CRISPR-associated protein Cmr4